MFASQRRRGKALASRCSFRKRWPWNVPSLHTITPRPRPDAISHGRGSGDGTIKHYERPNDDGDPLFTAQPVPLPRRGAERAAIIPPLDLHL